MYEIIERSCNTGGEAQIYGGYLTEEEAQAVADEMQTETDDYWYEVRREY